MGSIIDIHGVMSIVKKNCPSLALKPSDPVVLYLDATYFVAQTSKSKIARFTVVTFGSFG